MGLHVPSPKFLTISGDPGRVIYQILDIRKFTFSLKSVFMVDVRFELTTNDPWSVDDAICEVTGRRQSIPWQVCLFR